MKTRPLMLATALLLVFGTVQHAAAFSVGNSEFSNADGTPKFSDPDDVIEKLASANGQSATLPLANGSSMTFETTSVPASSCSGRGSGCGCPNCKGN